jgi:hypothetical protein
MNSAKKIAAIMVAFSLTFGAVELTQTATANAASKPHKQNVAKKNAAAKKKAAAKARAKKRANAGKNAKKACSKISLERKCLK